MLVLLPALALGGPGSAPEQPDAGHHWAYQPIPKDVQPPPPEPGVRNPVDAFLRRRLAEVGGAPAPEADRRTLIRRLSFDLVGLAPEPEAVEAFVSDPSPDAYDRLVDRLLASPQYGERWARHWMDAVHFAETHGHDQDRIRTNAWPYRDYLIASFNQDKPYARFLEEQIAGDVLFPEDPAATVALGLLAAGPWDESSLRDIREDTLDRQIARYLDRDDMITTVMSVVTSTTVHCARCHDHKFDPVPQRDYYALQAVFSGVDRANRTYDTDPKIHQRRQQLRQRRREIRQELPAALESAEARSAVAAWERNRILHPVRWSALEPETFLSTDGSRLVQQPDRSLRAEGPRPERDTYVITARLPLARVTAIRLDVLPDSTLPESGPGRADNGNLHLSEFHAKLFAPDAAEGAELSLVDPGADFNQEGWGVERAVDGSNGTAWGIHPATGRAHHAVFLLKTPLEVAEGLRLAISLRQLHGGGHLIGRFRLSVTDHPEATPEPPEAIANLLAQPEAGRSEADRRALASHVLETDIRRQLRVLPEPDLVYAAASDFEPDGGLKPADGPRPVFMLRRGEITQPIEPANPGALKCIPELPSRFAMADPSAEGARRAALADWLTADANPLTWRSVVNRVWRQHFGRGLAASLNDFGSMGRPPSHPQLLDWLAAWFRDEARGSFKQLHRLLVTSAAYRQSCDAPGGDPEFDPDNQLLSRMNRTRLDAECVRDAMLQAAGRLNFAMGGPSDRHFGLQPGIHVTPKVNYQDFDVDSETATRRSVYRFLFRTLPDPFMDALDCPAGDQLTPERSNSVTVQQALALWNDRFAVRQAEHLADRLASQQPSAAAQIVQACRLVWGRPPDAEELADLQRHAEAHGLASACRLLFNSNEFVYVD